MSSNDYLQAPAKPPALGIPASDCTVTVRVIDTTTRLSGAMLDFVDSPVKFHERFGGQPSFAFLISNQQNNVLFDLGLRTDRDNLPPAIEQMKEGIDLQEEVEKDVADILDEHAGEVGVGSRDIDAVIWSHHHWDHTGNMKTFPPSTDLVLGAGFKEKHLPGYPTDPESEVSDSDFEGRNVRELEFHDDQRIGNYRSIDYFGDGSFYLLDVPGHSIGHLAALARVSTSPDSFVLMGGDTCDGGAVMRPSEYLPLPKLIKPDPTGHYHKGCPGDLLKMIHPKKSAIEPFYCPSDDLNLDHEQSMESIKNLQVFDGTDNILTVVAHDTALLDQIDLFPKLINDWYAKDVDRKTRWAFIRDFKKAFLDVKD